MSNELQVYEDERFGRVRTVMGADGEPWFVAADVARVLEMVDATHAIRGLEEDEKGIRKVETLGGEQDMAVITEAGLYTVLVRSNKAIAKPFRRWVTHEVLPAIRKTGSYSLAPRTLQEALRAYADELDAHENTRKELAATNEQVEGLKVRLDESESFWSILTLCERYGFRWDTKKRGLAGKRASAYCRWHGYEIRRAHDDRFGDVNAYPCEVLDRLFVADKF